MEDLKKEIESLKKENKSLKKRVQTYWEWWDNAENTLVRRGFLTESSKMCPKTPFEDEIKYLEKK